MNFSRIFLLNAEPICGSGLVSFYAAYVEYISPYLFFIVSIIGSTLNIFCIIVFTRKSMISPNNLIFAHLAIVDLATLITYMPRWANEAIRLKMYSVKEHRTYEWEIIGKYSYHVAAIFHGTSVWLAIMLAVWRYIAIVHPLKERQWCNLKTTKIFIAVGYVTTCSFGIIPFFFALEVQAFDRLLDSDGYITWNRTIGIPTKLFLLQPVESSREITILLALATAVIVKILPMVLVSVYSYKCIVALQLAKNRRKKLTIRLNESNTTNTRKNPLTDRTTRMLLVILALFFTPEMPHAIFFLLVVIIGQKFDVCLSYLFEVFNDIVLVCISCNFIVYYTMSRQFHDTFIQLFNSKPSSAQPKPALILADREVHM
ncbi:sex peptide receptor-related protein 2-like [Planococcus citri]|uniref:sex peptide receptor-related protein 2-like n=1 Tax=Planococcus citri TaxID=170843 RepID=UPI0031F80767